MLLAYSSLIMISEYDFFHLIPFIQSNIYTYFGFIIIVTFGYLYYRGPFSTPKAFKIIELILKGISFIIFYFGISNKEIALGIFGIIVWKIFTEIIDKNLRSHQKYKVCNIFNTFMF